MLDATQRREANAFVRMRSYLRAPRRTRSRITDEAVIKSANVKRAVRASWGTHVRPRAETREKEKRKRCADLSR